jgi:hypothetical protein
MYALLGQRVFGAKDQAAALEVTKELKTKLRERMPLLEEVQALFPQILFTDSITKQKGLIKYILVEFLRRMKPGIAIDFESMTIEHIAPQSQIGVGEFSEENIGQLGNLVLVSSELNQKLGNKTFPEKKALMMAAQLLPPDLAPIQNWTAAEIRARTTRMAGEAHSTIWRI